MNLKKLQEKCNKKCQPRIIWRSANFDWMTGGKLRVQGQYIRAIHGPIGSDRRAAA